MKQIDVTGDNFDRIDCTEGNLFFDSFSEGDTFKVKIWGVGFVPELGSKEDGSYIHAMSELVFENTAYIHLNYGIYADRTCQGFIKNMTSDSTDLCLELGKKENLDGCTQYIFGGILGRYLGYAEITLYCKGNVKLTYDENALINVREYCSNPKKYSFDRIGGM